MSITKIESVWVITQIQRHDWGFESRSLAAFTSEAQARELCGKFAGEDVYVQLVQLSLNKPVEAEADAIQP